MLTPTTPRRIFGLRIFNPDGSEAEKSGNGLRIFAKWLRDHGHAKQDRLHGGHQGRGGGVPAAATRGGRVEFVIVEMGRATFRRPTSR
jgi:diaminopimelate epimerase